MSYDYLIVGSGLAGAVIAERIASQLDKKVLVIDRRGHIGGNCHDFTDENGIIVHKYGPHIFHTNSRKIWEYLSRFTDWTLYFHHVLAVVEGKKVPVPFNFNSICQLFPPKLAAKLEDALLRNYGYGLKIPILKLKQTKDNDLKFLAEYIYRNIFYGYTLKQWGYKPEELDFWVTSRVPVYISTDNRYFQDTYQGIPSLGYTEMIRKMLDHKNIQIQTGTEYKSAINDIQFNKLVFTGEIDYFFDFIHGRLPYRSLSFDFRTYDAFSFQEVAQVNYPNNFDYTRITEFRHFAGQMHKDYPLKNIRKGENPRTTVAYEYPHQYDGKTNEPYYPIPKPESEEIFKKYKEEAAKLKDSVHFIGRLADYKYYNMDNIVGVALMYFEKQIAQT